MVDLNEKDRFVVLKLGGQNLSILVRIVHCYGKQPGFSYSTWLRAAIQVYIINIKIYNF